MSGQNDMQGIIEKLAADEVSYVLVGRDEFPDRMILLPGSFNPFHSGHAGLLSAAEKISEREGVYELSISNVDKPPLSSEEIEKRLQQMPAHHATVLTCAPTFSEKAVLFPDAWFVLGYDTTVRLLSPNYHDDIPAMLARFMEQDTRFVVAGRLHNDEFQGLENISIPEGFEELFIPLPQHLFREDISSTELRRKKL